MRFRTFISVLGIGLVCGWACCEQASANTTTTTATTATTASEFLVIDSIRLDGKEVVVTVHVPAGVKRVVLESRRRVDAGSWEPVAIERLEDSATGAHQVVFRVALTAQMELLRVRGDSGDVLPAAFYQGTDSFGNPTGGTADAAMGGPERVETAVPPGAEPTKDATGGDTAAREVVESDIWKIEGDTMYFFNQYRGLQIIDVADPEAPVIRGTYEMPAAGEQMYVLSPTQVVLLAHDFCGGWGASAEGEIVLIDVKDGKPQLAGTIPVPGSVRESRMVGTALYVVSERYVRVQAPSDKGGEYWEWGSQIASFDLSDFTPTEAKFTAWAPGYGNSIQATDRFLFVSSRQPNSTVRGLRSDVQVFDISSPDGAMRALSTISLAGEVKDKFKMHLNGDVFIAVTEVWDGALKSVVETFSLADPANPQRLASLPIIERERLFATRFSGNRLYVVTFFQVDPLWIIDLTDPANPRKVGELEIPGWSTFIQPLGDRLVTVGIDNTEGWRTSVQLFDVQNPEKPALLSKVLLGEGHSYSEANQDEKAFGVLPEHQLILVPFSSWTDQGNVQAVQLIDLEPDTLKKRGLINHDFAARRATMHRDRILSISGTELLGVDTTDRDQPKVVSRTELSWGADRIFLQGDHLVTISQQGKRPNLHVTLAGGERELLKRVELSELPLLGAVVSEQRLFVLQGKSTEVLWPKVWNETNYAPVGTNAATLTLSVFDLKALPEVSRLGELNQSFDDTHKYWGQFEALWPKPGILVWSSAMGGMGGGYWWRGGLMPVDAVPNVAVDRVGIGVAPIWWGGYGASLLAYDVADASAPALVSEVSLSGTNNWWNFSQARTANGLVYLSHETSEWDATLQLPERTYQKWDGTKYVTVTETPPPGSWVQRHYLDVVSYGDPAAPAIRKPVDIPGALIGLARNGNLLYTQAYRYGEILTVNDWSERIDVSAYDGVEVRLVDSLTLPPLWPHPAVVLKDHLFLARPADTNLPAAIEVWTVDDSAKLKRVGETIVKPSIQTFVEAGGMLIGQAYPEISLYDLSNPPSLVLLGSGNPGGCFGYSINYSDGAPDRGLWIPIGPYGVVKVEVKPQ